MSTKLSKAVQRKYKKLSRDMQEIWKRDMQSKTIESNISNVHHFPANPFSESTDLNNIICFFCGERKEREKRLTGLGLNDIKQTVQNRTKGAEPTHRKR